MDPVGLEIGLFTFGSGVISPEKNAKSSLAGKSQGCCLIGKYLLKTGGQFSSYSYLWFTEVSIILLIEEILHHLGCIKQCKSWDKLPYQLVQDYFHQQYFHIFFQAQVVFFVE